MGNRINVALNDDIGTGDSTISLPCDANAPAQARHYVSAHLGWLPPADLDDALVLVSELVSNAVRYGEPEITLQLRTDPPGVAVAVSDHGPELPRVVDTPPEPQAISGRGLLIVDALANRWGITPDRPPPGKTVWFEITPGLGDAPIPRE